MILPSKVASDLLEAISIVEKGEFYIVRAGPVDLFVESNEKTGSIWLTVKATHEVREFLKMLGGKK